MGNKSDRFVLFLVDGMRPDGMIQAATPNIDRLIAAGAHTLTARTVMPSMTLPCHMSLFHSVPPARHGITTNLWTPQVRPVQGLFDILQQRGLITAAFYNWEELRDVGRPGALSVSFMIKDSRFDGSADTMVAETAAQWLGNNSFHFAFVYLGGVDISGHLSGWMSDPYLRAIEHADRCIGTVLARLPAKCTLMVTSDHGGHDQTHGTDSPQDMQIPIVLSGPDIAPTTALAAAAQITDIAPTIAAFFNVQAPDAWIGTSLLDG